MNLGGEPERDDSGLPPVDIEIPDDARELDRDVQAYHRELRAQRRRQRRIRLVGPLGRDGVVLPLFASCLVVALIAGTLLTVFAPRGDFPSSGSASSPRAGGSASASATSSASAGSPVATLVTGKLPAGFVTVANRQLALAKLTSSVLALVPARCGCGSAVSQLVSQAQSVRVPVYLVAGPGGLAQARQLAGQAGLGQAGIAEDSKDVLSRTYSASGLTALLIGQDGSVSVARSLQSGLRMSGQLQALAAARPAPAS